MGCFGVSRCLKQRGEKEETWEKTERQEEKGQNMKSTDLSGCHVGAIFTTKAEDFFLRFWNQTSPPGERFVPKLSLTKNDFEIASIETIYKVHANFLKFSFPEILKGETHQRLRKVILRELLSGNGQLSLIFGVPNFLCIFSPRPLSI